MRVFHLLTFYISCSRISLSRGVGIGAEPFILCVLLCACLVAFWLHFHYGCNRGFFPTLGSGFGIELRLPKVTKGL